MFWTLSYSRIKMLRLTLIFALVILTVARRDHLTLSWLQNKIIGGVDTTIEEFPYQAALQLMGRLHCGASIIGPNKVLTAAHCTNDFQANSFTVRVGSSNYDKGGTVVKVQSICQHPQYDDEIYNNDVAVLILAESLNTTSAIQPIALAELGSSVPVGTLAVATGWGKVNETGPFPKTLQKVEVPKISQQDCKKAYSDYTFTDSMTCYGYPNGGKDTCQGDSGGPLAIGRTLVGVSSWGVGCGRRGKPGIYADVSKAIIRNHINSC